MTVRTLHNLHTIDIAPDEVGSTVRKGRKWSGVKRGEDIELCVCTKDPETHEVVGYGTVEHVRLTYPRGILAWEIANEHAAEARTYDGLLEGLERAYGEFSEYEEFVVMHYRRTA